MPVEERKRVEVRKPLSEGDKGTRNNASTPTKQDEPPPPTMDYGTVDHAEAAESVRPASIDGTLDTAPPPSGTLDHEDPNATGGLEFLADEKPVAKLPESMNIAGYEVIDILGRGAMGVVYKARQRGLRRLVALKMILSGEHASENDLARFRIEANAVAQLQHPGIVQLYEVGEDNGRPFFSLEFVDGPSLHKQLQGTPMPPKQGAEVVQKMAAAMAYAHSHGVIHRDLKPANVLMTADGQPKISDFGLAKTVDDESGVTRSGTILGTPSYMSPEQGAGLIEQVGPLADVYSLGAILYDVLTGRPPFRGTSVLDTLQQLRSREPVRPVQLQPSVPRDLETICLKCLEKDRTKRYSDAGALADDLQRFINGEPILARPISVVERAWRWCRRNPRKAGAIAAAVLGVAVYAVSVSVLAGMLEVEKKEAVEARNDAVEKKRQADASAAEARRQQGIAERETVIANENLEQQKNTAKTALEGMLEFATKQYEMLQSRRLSIDASPEIRKLRADALADMRRTLDNITRKINAAAKQTYSDLYAAQALGQLLMKFGQVEEPRKLFEEALVSVKARVEADPNNDRARGNMGVIEQLLGDVALDQEQDALTAKAHYTRCRDLHEEIRLRPRSGEFTPIEIKRLVAHDDVRLGRALVALGQSEAAAKLFHEALGYYGEWLADTPADKQAEPKSYVMQVRMWLGIAASQRGDIKGLEEHFGAAHAIGQALTQGFPGYLPFTVDMAELQCAFGDALLRHGKPAEARKSLEAALTNLKIVSQKRPDDTSNQSLLALAHERLGLAAAMLKADDAKDHIKTSMQLRKELFEIENKVFARQVGFVLTIARSGDLVTATRLAATIRPRMEKSPVLMLQIARCFAVCAATDRANVEPSMSALTVATAGEFRDADALLTDPDLAALRDEPSFKELIAKIKAR